MKKTPIQNVIDKVEKLVRESEVGTEERRKINLVISYLWDELDNERKTISESIDSSRVENLNLIGKRWVDKHFMDYKKFL
jgi:hypothetical protein